MPKIKRQRFYDYLSYDLVHNPVFPYDIFAQKHHMEMREITRYYTTLNMMTSASIAPNGNAKSIWFCFYFLLPVAVGLQKCDITKYYQFVEGEDSAPLTDLLSDENVLNYVFDFFPGIQESEAKQLVETVYRAILVDAKNKKSNTIHGYYYNESTFNYFNRTISLLCSTTSLK